MAKKKKTYDTVQIYERKTQRGTTLYLHYSINGEQRRENTGLRLTGEPLADDVTMKAVKMLQAQRTTEIINGKTGLSITQNGNAAAKVKLSDFVRLIGSEKEKRATQNNYYNVAQKIDQCSKIRLCDINKSELLKIIAHFKETLKPTTQRTYTTNLSGALKIAKKRNLIKDNPFDFLEKGERPATQKPNRDYLTNDELNDIINLTCKSRAENETKEAFIFSSLTGLRYSDIYKLTAKNFEDDGQTVRLKTTTQKTGVLANFVLPTMAAEIIRPRMDEAHGKDGRLFKLTTNCMVNRTLNNMIARTDITDEKRVTFHTARHTFATLLITKGASLFAVSKLLGHTDIKTTQIYAELVGKKKDETISLLNDL